MKIFSIVPICMISLAFITGCDNGKKINNSEDSTYVRPSQIGQLGTIKVVFEDAAFAKQSKAGIGPTNKIAWMYYGEAIVGIDMTKVKISSAGNNTIKINLPDAEIINSRIDFNKSEKVDFQKSSWRTAESMSRLQEELHKEEAMAIKKAASDDFILKLAQMQAKMCLIGMYSAVDKEIKLEWE